MTDQHFRLAISGVHHNALIEHLFPGDGLEAAAILLCSHSSLWSHRLAVQKVIPVPYKQCVRESHFVSWPSDAIEGAIQEAKHNNLSIILAHSHPNGSWEFSETDNCSDLEIVPDIYDELQDTLGNVGTALVTPDGGVKSRIYDRNIIPVLIQRVLVVGTYIQVFSAKEKYSRPMAFGAEMTNELAELCACVVGVSGTGSVVAEQLARLGFGKILLIDPDHVEKKNLNRILNSRIVDANNNRLKTDRFRDAIATYSPNTDVLSFPMAIEAQQAILAAGHADFLFCCVDSATGRQISDLIASSFVLPLFDVGVTIPTVRLGSQVEIADVCGRIDYVQPGGSSLYDRAVYTQEMLRAEELSSSNPEQFASELADGYIQGVAEEAPSVISLNMRAASAVVNEFIARTYPYRFESSDRFCRTEFSLADMHEEHYPESNWTTTATKYLLGRGEALPLLGIPGLGNGTAEAGK